MQGNFSYHNPTKLYLGDESLESTAGYIDLKPEDITEILQESM